MYDGTTGKIVGRLPDGVLGLPGGLMPSGTRYLGLNYTYIPKTDDGPDGGWRNELILCDWKARRVLAVLTGFPAGKIDRMVGASADGKTAVVASTIGQVWVFDLSVVK